MDTPGGEPGMVWLSSSDRICADAGPKGRVEDCATRARSYAWDTDSLIGADGIALAVGPGDTPLLAIGGYSPGGGTMLLTAPAPTAAGQPLDGAEEGTVRLTTASRWIDLPEGADLDGDGVTEAALVVATKGVGAAWLYPGPLMGDLVEADAAATLLDVVALDASSDLDGDGTADVVASGPDTGLRVWSGPAILAGQAPLATGASVTSISVAGDLDADGRHDLLVSAPDGEVFLAPLAGFLDLGTASRSWPGTGWTAFAPDLDRDGQSELLTEDCYTDKDTYKRYCSVTVGMDGEAL